MNLVKIVNTTRRLKSTDKSNLTNVAKLSYPTILNTIKDNAEYFIQDDRGIRLNPNIAQYVGVSIGTSHIKIVILDYTFGFCKSDALKGFFQKWKEFVLDDLIDGLCVRTPVLFTDIVNTVNDILYDLLVIEKLNIKGIGFSFSGFIDNEKNVVVKCFNIQQLNNLNMDSLLRRDVCDIVAVKKIVCVFEHDAKACCVGEKELSVNCLNGDENLATIYLGTGIGCGLIMGNHLIPGPHNRLGQLGHLKLFNTIKPDQEFLSPAYEEKSIEMLGKCDCGEFGCVEQLIRSDVFEFSNPIDFKKFSLDNATETQIAHLGKYTAWLASHLVNILSIDTIILTGKLSQVYNRMWPYFSKHFENYCFSGLGRDCEVRNSRLGMFSPAIGAAICSYFKENKLSIEW